MAEKITASDLARELKMPVEQLIAQFKAANMRIKESDQEVSPAQKQKIVKFLEDNATPIAPSPKEQTKSMPAVKEEATEKKSPSSTLKLSRTVAKTLSEDPVVKSEATKEKKAASEEGPRKITLRRKTLSQLNITGNQGDKRTVDVKVIKKRTYVKRSVVTPQREEEQKVRELEAEAKRVELEAEKQVSPAKQEVIAAGSSAQQVEEAKKEELKKAEKNFSPKPMTEEDIREEKAKKKKRPKADDFDHKHHHRRLDIKAIELEDDFIEEEPDSVATSTVPSSYVKSAVKYHKKQKFEIPSKPIAREISIPETISVGELAQKMAVKGAQVVKALMKMGVMATMNEVIEQDTAILVVEEMGHVPVAAKLDAVEDTIHEGLSLTGEVHSRPPVVTIMGHVDHGKTTLLDYIRRTRVAAGEAGGITQNIGAYHVETERGTVTFLDTPGHEAFTAMRARGAQATDIVVLVVAADDGVMPQTVEAIQHAKAGKVPIVVAVNKIDKPEANPEKIKAELANHDVLLEAWGGDVMSAHISAKTGEGIDALLESVLLQAEMLELTARAQGPAQGLVIEARLDKGRGPVADVLVQQGELQIGDIILAGKYYGRVRAMLDEKGRPIKKAGPSIPVEILGLSDTPEAGDEFTVVATERKAKEIADFRKNKQRQERTIKEPSASMENLFAQLNTSNVAILRIVLKANVQGSLEALTDSLNKLSTDHVKVEIVSRGVGGITSSDVNLALASNAVIIGFNVRPDGAARQVIEQEEVDIRYHSIIYDAIDEVKKAMEGILKPEFKEEIIGLAEVRDVFRSSKLGAIAGCMVIEGIVKRNKPIRVLRDNVVIYEGELESLRRFKEDVNEVRHGMECGIGVKNYNDIKSGDQIEVFDSVKVERKL